MVRTSSLLPESSSVLDSWLLRFAGHSLGGMEQAAMAGESPPERHATTRIRLRDVMPIDFLDAEERTLPAVIPAARVKPYQSRLEVLGAERIHEMVTSAASAMERSVPNDVLARADRTWFGAKRPFRAAREALMHIEDDLERWEQELAGQGI